MANNIHNKHAHALPKQKKTKCKQHTHVHTHETLQNNLMMQQIKKMYAHKENNNMQLKKTEMHTNTHPLTHTPKHYIHMKRQHVPALNKRQICIKKKNTQNNTHALHNTHMHTKHNHTDKHHEYNLTYQTLLHMKKHMDTKNNKPMQITKQHKTGT